MERITISIEELKPMMVIPQEKQEIFDTWTHFLNYGFLWNEFILYITELTQRYKVEIVGRDIEQVVKITKTQLDKYGLPVKKEYHEVKVVAYLQTLAEFIVSSQSKSFNELYKDNYDFIDIVPPMSFIQYMIIESKKRNIEYIEAKESTPRTSTSKSKNSRQKEYSLLDAIKIYRKKENSLKRKYERHTLGWDVRGFWRHNPNGTQTWIAPYPKGDNRNHKSKDFILKKEK